MSEMSQHDNQGAAIKNKSGLPVAQQVAIIVAIIGCIGTILVAIIGIIPPIISISATKTAVAPLTNSTPSETPLPEQTLPAPPLSDSSTETPVTVSLVAAPRADGMLMVYIPAGDFDMGSNDGCEDEKPVHTVYTDAFWIDETEVTNLMYSYCVNAGICNPPANDNFGKSDYVNHPVVNITWVDASQYCALLDGRLPLEAEWEKAARGGLEGMEYPWGDQSPDCIFTEYGVQYAPCPLDDTVPVKKYAPNGFGLYGMAGNVWEWVKDVYAEDYYAASGGVNPTGPLTGSYRVVRGGSWMLGEQYLRVASRGYLRFDDSADDVGFRCVRDITP